MDSSTDSRHRGDQTDPSRSTRSPAYSGGKATNRIAPEKGLASILGVLVVLALAFVPVSGLGLVPLVGLCGVIRFLLFAVQPFYQEAVAVHTSAKGRGLSYGYTYLSRFGLGASGVAIGGYVYGGFPLWAFFAVLSTFALVGSGLSVLLLVRHGDASDDPASDEPADDD
jgi:predicted MFS family arabinose efflux permease